MKLYLSSYKLGNRPNELVNLLGDRKKIIAYIPNALDFATDLERRKQSINSDIDELKAIGITVEELDLRLYFNKTAELSAQLSKYGAVFVRGGNCFVLRRAFYMSGLDKLLPELIRTEALVYSGYSAGIDMLAPSLHGAELVDDPYTIPIGYDAKIIWECLNLLTYTVTPHYKSNHNESADMDKSIEYMINNYIPFIALRDGEVIIIDGEKHNIIS